MSEDETFRKLSRWTYEELDNHIRETCGYYMPAADFEEALRISGWTARELKDVYFLKRFGFDPLGRSEID